MASLSRRARRLLDAPPFAPYLREHFARFAGHWDPAERPDGYIPLCIAENKRKAAALLARLARYRDVPARVLGYDAMIGNLEFREHLAAFMGRTFLGRTFGPENLAVVAGAGSVLELLFHALADPGEGVLVPTPSYAGFWADLETRDELAIVRVDGSSADGFALTTERLDAAIAGAGRPVRALLFTNPDNPLARVASRETLLEIVGWAERRGVHVVFDEIYALSVFGATPFVSGASLRPSLGDFVHIVWAFSKDFGASGLRCGVLVSENAEVISAVDQLAYWSACSGHTQFLLSSFVADAAAVDAHVAEVRRDLAETHDAVVLALAQAGIAHIPAAAAYFLVCDLREFLDEPTVAAERRLWQRLLDEANVNLTPGEACRIAEPGFFRLCYAGVELAAVLVAIERMARCLGAGRRSRVADPRDAL
ncbi:MAG TPA: aminotransferase class I/II-fold pyridoxal phosphate-dependent enzyme [Nannocystaceae bacterium]|nr:aminotransferase class I/II-fold pyridoxal phosphate-dependent enzyme [Nannocystaceae bacterium]